MQQVLQWYICFCWLGWWQSISQTFCYMKMFFRSQHVFWKNAWVSFTVYRNSSDLLRRQGQGFQLHGIGNMWFAGSRPEYSFLSCIMLFLFWLLFAVQGKNLHLLLYFYSCACACFSLTNSVHQGWRWRWTHFMRTWLPMCTMMDLNLLLLIWLSLPMTKGSICLNQMKSVLWPR